LGWLLHLTNDFGLLYGSPNVFGEMGAVAWRSRVSVCLAACDGKYKRQTHQIQPFRSALLKAAGTSGRFSAVAFQSIGG